jgi:type II secretory pathway predicted ATPase ExeA/septal ring-binding cell division protein DamX
MYLTHFGLHEAPYRITPHTDFFFEGANRGATLEALLYAITHDEGIVKVTGEVGSGKTMLCRVLMERLPADVETIYLANPSLARDEIMLAILDDLKVPAAGERSSLLLRALQERLVELYAAGRKVVVLIDEAHAMPVETLEEIRLLSNLESKRHKLLQIVLFGQQELDDVLGMPQMRQLKERIVHSFRLEPLVRQDIGAYLMFRMRLAGYKGPDLFSAPAVRRIADASEGLTRRINILADKALLAAFSEGEYQIAPKHVDAAIRDSEFSRLKGKRRDSRAMMWLAAAAVGLIAAGAAVALLAVYLKVQANPEYRASSARGIGTLAAPPRPTAGVIAPAPAAAATDPTGPDTVKPAAVAEVAKPAAPAAMPAPVAAAAPAPVANRPATPAGPPKATEVPATASKSPQGAGLLERRRQATEVWLQEAPKGTHTLQLLTADAARAGEIDAWLTKLPAVIDRDAIFVYETMIKGAPRFGVLYGAFADRGAASAAMAELPKKLRDARPIIRTAGGIRADLKSP